ncbi:MAG: glycosyltransferase family 39 protein [Anaerolineales bacterium]
MRGDILAIIRETARRHWGLGLALLLAIGGKLALLGAQVFPFNADEAVVALMARHILQGERPLFFYGQAYMGSLDAFLTAALFALFGPQVWVVRALEALLFAGTITVWYFFCAEAFDSLTVARIAVLLLAVPPVLVTLYTTVSIGGYGEALLLGSLGMLLALQIRRGKTHPARWLILGFTVGIGFWSFPLSLVLSFPALLTAIWYKPSEQKSQPMKYFWTHMGILFLGLIAGISPWIAGWIQLGASAFRELGGSAIAGTIQGGPGTVLLFRLLDLGVFGVTALFGLRPSWEIRWLAPVVLPFAVAIDLTAIVYAVRNLRLRDAARPARWMMAGSIAILILVYLFTPFGNDPSGRYFLPLALVLAAFCAELIARAAARFGRAAYLLLPVLMLFQGAGTVESALRVPPGITTQFDPVAQLDQRDLPQVIAFLRAHGETRGYTNYWVSFPLAFQSGEELIFTAQLPYHPDLRYTSRDDRYPPYDDLVEAAGRVAYITTKNPALDSLLEAAFAAHGIRYQFEQIGDFRIYYDLSAPLRPEQLYQLPFMD